MRPVSKEKRDQILDRQPVTSATSLGPISSGFLLLRLLPTPTLTAQPSTQHPPTRLALAVN